MMAWDGSLELESGARMSSAMKSFGKRYRAGDWVGGSGQDEQNGRAISSCPLTPQSYHNAHAHSYDSDGCGNHGMHLGLETGRWIGLYLS